MKVVYSSTDPCSFVFRGEESTEIYHNLLGPFLTDHLSTMATLAQVHALETARTMVLLKKENAGMVPAFHLSAIYIGRGMLIQRLLRFFDEKWMLKATV